MKTLMGLYTTNHFIQVIVIAPIVVVLKILNLALRD